MEKYYKHKPANIVLFDYVKEKNNLLQKHFLYGRKGNRITFWNETLLNDLLHFFSSNLLEKRYFYADRLVDWFLGTHDTEEFNEFRRSLTKLEIDGRLFSNYRDHTNHTFLVFILGAYLYEKLDRFREYYRLQCARDRKLDPSIPDAKDTDKVNDNFIFDWLYVSLLHDIGYTFSHVDEEDDQSSSPLLPRALKIMDTFFNQYVRNWFPFEERPKIEQDVIDLHILLDMCMKVPAIKDARRIRKKELQEIIQWLTYCPYFKELSTNIKSTDSFEILRSYSSSFAPQHSEMLRKWFLLLATEGEGWQKGENRIFDHGILSALVYMKLVSFAFLVLMKIKDMDLSQIRSLRQRELIKRAKEDIGKYRYREESFYEFVGIAWAIAMHNIRPLVGPERIASFNKTMFPIRPGDSFLACLLYLVDVLQEWDRDKLRLVDYTSPATASLQSYEISIQVIAQRIRISYVDNETTRDRIGKMKKDLENLDKKIRSIIDFDPIPDDLFFKIET